MENKWTQLAQYKPYGYPSTEPMLGIANQYKYPDAILVGEMVYTFYVDPVEDNDVSSLIVWLLSADLKMLVSFANDLADARNMPPPNGFRAVMVPNPDDGSYYNIAYEVAYFDEDVDRTVRYGPFSSGAKYAVQNSARVYVPQPA